MNTRKTSRLEHLVARAIATRLIAWRDIRMMVGLARDLSDRAQQSRVLARSVSAVARALAAEFDACAATAGRRWCADESRAMRLLPFLVVADGRTWNRRAMPCDSRREAR